MEPVFDKLEGVNSVISGFSGGNVPNPTYQQVVAGRTGHIETVKVSYNPEKITYLELLKNFWVNVDPYDGSGNFVIVAKYIHRLFFIKIMRKKILLINQLRT